MPVPTCPWPLCACHLIHEPPDDGADERTKHEPERKTRGSDDPGCRAVVSAAERVCGSGTYRAAVMAAQFTLIG